MSKQVNCVNIEPEILHRNWSSYWKYNGVYFFVNPFTSCKTDIISHYNAGHTYTMRNTRNSGLATLHGIKLSP